MRSFLVNNFKFIGPIAVSGNVDEELNFPINRGVWENSAYTKWEISAVDDDEASESTKMLNIQGTLIGETMRDSTDAEVLAGDEIFCLEIMDSHRKGEIYPIGERLTLGRSSGMLNFKESSVSGLHCTLRVQEGVVALMDNGSANGTFVAGRRITAGRMVLLKENDLFLIGQVRIKIVKKKRLDPQLKSPQIIDAEMEAIKKIDDENTAPPEPLTQTKIPTPVSETNVKPQSKTYLWQILAFLGDISINFLVYLVVTHNLYFDLFVENLSKHLGFIPSFMQYPFVVALQGMAVMGISYLVLGKTPTMFLLNLKWGLRSSKGILSYIVHGCLQLLPISLLLPRVVESRELTAWGKSLRIIFALVLLPLLLVLPFTWQLAVKTLNSPKQLKRYYLESVAPMPLPDFPPQLPLNVEQTKKSTSRQLKLVMGQDIEASSLKMLPSFEVVLESGKRVVRPQFAFYHKTFHQIFYLQQNLKKNIFEFPVALEKRYLNLVNIEPLSDFYERQLQFNWKSLMQLSYLKSNGPFIDVVVNVRDFLFDREKLQENEKPYYKTLTLSGVPFLLLKQDHLQLFSLDQTLPLSYRIIGPKEDVGETTYYASAGELIQMLLQDATFIRDEIPYENISENFDVNIDSFELLDYYLFDVNGNMSAPYREKIFQGIYNHFFQVARFATELGEPKALQFVENEMDIFITAHELIYKGAYSSLATDLMKLKKATLENDKVFFDWGASTQQDDKTEQKSEEIPEEYRDLIKPNGVN